MAVWVSMTMRAAGEGIFDVQGLVYYEFISEGRTVK
jgi:hypothetical protein